MPITEHEQNYASIGSILSFPVDSYSDTSPVGGAGSEVKFLSIHTMDTCIVMVEL